MTKFKDLFRRRQQDGQEPERMLAWQEKIITVQKRCARWLQLKTGRLSPASQKVMLFAFFTVSALLSSHFLIRPTGKSSVEVGRVTLPANPEAPANPAFLTGVEYNRLKSFRQHMDSLARSPDGSHQYRDFNKAHPGLLDSIRTLEQLYDLHIKNRKKWK